MTVQHKAFLALAAGIFVAMVAEGFVASIANPLLTPLKLNI